jgi:hypothetical protein
MARVRYSRTKAQAEATLRAAAFIAGRTDRDHWRHVITTADTVRPRHSSKHPVVWVAMYSPVPSDGSATDGGELFVIVDLELGTVDIRE